MERLREKYNKEIVPALQKEFGYKNKLSVPKIDKISVNIGVSKALKDDKYMEVMIDTLRRITGQNPVKTLSKKAISGFSIRKGMVVGLAVTLRKQMMYDFFEKLVNIVLPRVRDFRGISPKSVDERGNIAIGFKEHIVFPEIRADEVEKLHGLEVSISTTAQTREEGYKLLSLMGIPFATKEEDQEK